MQRQRNAFTLIELLVVIAIIAILAAILFPVFAQAKAAAKASAGVSNVRQMGQAIVLYQNDADDSYPLAAYAVNPDDMSQGFRIWHDILDPYVKNKDVWHCPGSSVKITDANGTITSHWGYNTRYLTTLAFDFSNANNHTATNSSQIEQPSDTIVFTSAKSSTPPEYCGDDGKYLLPPSEVEGVPCWGRPDPVITEAANIAWADTHANRKKMPQFYSGQQPVDRFFDLQ